MIVKRALHHCYILQHICGPLFLFAKIKVTIKCTKLWEFWIGTFCNIIQNSGFLQAGLIKIPRLSWPESYFAWTLLFQEHIVPHMTGWFLRNHFGIRIYYKCPAQTRSILTPMIRIPPHTKYKPGFIYLSPTWFVKTLHIHFHRFHAPTL